MVSQEERRRKRRRLQNQLKANEERRKKLELDSRKCASVSSHATTNQASGNDNDNKPSSSRGKQTIAAPSSSAAATTKSSGWLDTLKAESAKKEGATWRSEKTLSKRANRRHKTERDSDSSSDSDHNNEERKQAKKVGASSFQYDSPPVKKSSQFLLQRSSVLSSSNKASPQSDVTFSQDPTRNKNNSEEKDLSDEEDIFAPVVLPKLPPQQRTMARSNSSSSSSSSDDSFDLEQLAALKEQSRANKLKQNNASTVAQNQRDKPSEEKEPAASNRRGDAADRSNSQDHRHKGKNTKMDDSDSGSESDDSNSPWSRRRRRGSSITRNPVTKLKEDLMNPLPSSSSPPSQLSQQKTSPNHAKNEANMEELMWLDTLDGDDDDDKKEDVKKQKNSKTVKKAKRGSKKQPRAALDKDSGSDQDSDRDGNSKRKRQKQKIAGESDEESVSAGSLGGYESELGEMEDYEEIRDASMPEFHNPQFGPFNLEPFVLGNATGPGEQEEGEYQIPASIARYLPPFQSEGVEFLFNTVTKNTGAILGDDMGVGKTVQTAALLAALFKLSGTGKDLVEICERRKKIQQMEGEKQKAAELALERGEAYNDPTSNDVELLRKAWSPVWIMSPAGVMNNWVTDLGTWGHFSLAVYSPDNGYSGLDKIQSGKADILISSHAALANKRHYPKLSEVPWTLVIIDEFHMLKNEKGIKSQNIRELRDKLDCKIIGLTGTLMQNNHEELWSLVDVVAPGLLGTRTDFKNEVSAPIKLSRVKNASPDAVERGSRKQKELMTKLDTLYLKRTKIETLGHKLPMKSEKIVFCAPSPLQQTLYSHFLKQPEFVCLAQAHLLCDCGRNAQFFKNINQLETIEEQRAYYKMNKGSTVRRCKCCYRLPTTTPGGEEIDRRAVLWLKQHPDEMECPGPLPVCPFCLIFPCMVLLNKLSSHVSLILPENVPDALEGKKREDAEKALAIADAYIPKTVVAELPGGSLIRQNSVMNDHFNLSGKMKALSALLSKLELKEERVLLFSYSTASLDLIQDYIQSTGYSFLRMDGGTSAKKRIELAEKFKQDKNIFIFLLSTKAMGLGLNLTSASTVIIFDVEWNPSFDEQAQDRAYRIGQSKDVTVYRLVSRGTIEELRYLRQVYKQQLQAKTFDKEETDKKDKKRVFMGVQDDTSRRGELFGTCNLLRFDPRNTFMKYGEDTKEAREFGDSCVIYDMEAFSSAAKGYSEIENEEDIDTVLGLEKQAGARNTTQPSQMHVQSQTFADLCKSVAPLETGVDELGSPHLGTKPKTAAKADEEKEAPAPEEKTVSSNELGQKSATKKPKGAGGTKPRSNSSKPATTFSLNFFDVDNTRTKKKKKKKST